MPAQSGPEVRAGGSRPGVSIVVPFAGGEKDARRLVAALSVLSLGSADEIIVADNSRAGIVAGLTPTSIRVVTAEHERSSYYARNRGAEEASNGWILFLDADCRPAPDLLDRYFGEPTAPTCGIVAGGVVGLEAQTGLLPAWARSRQQLSETHLVNPKATFPHPATGTGNMLVRRDVWEWLGGFHEGVRSGADVEFCWRVQDAGWSLEHRPDARVEHSYGVSIRGLVHQAVRHAAGRRWLNRRYSQAFASPTPASDLARSAGGALIWLATLRPRRALYKAIDGIALLAGAWGWWLGRNGVRPASEGPVASTNSRSLVTITDAFPARSETFVYNEVLELGRQGWVIRVESLARPARVERSVARVVRVNYLEDDAPRDKVRDLAWLVVRHPVRCSADLRAQRRWRAEEEVWPLAAIASAARRLEDSGARHVHAHFAAGGALTALRLSRLTGVPYSLTAHAYDIFQSPKNLREKLSRASFAAAECEYAADQLRAVAHRASVHRIATGTDTSTFERASRYEGTGEVLAIGRLVEKKGFSHLIRAAERLRAEGLVQRITIAGEGPLASELRELRDELDLGEFVRFSGPVWGPEAVREMLETADLLVIPSVVAADGDRDALPLVAYEALSMEVPVVASDLVGLPELVRPPWGLLTPPGDHEALADVLTEMLSRPVAERIEAGRRGRDFVNRCFDPSVEAGRLGALIEGE